jgi:opacity protein-like surface antigen
MKKLTVTIILALTMIYSTGQVVESIGIKGGISYASQTWEYTSPDFTVKKDFKTGSAIVLTADFFKSRHLCLTTDLGFIQKGFQEEIPMTSEEFPEDVLYYKTYNATINYLTFSPKLSVDYKFNNLRAYCFIGPRLDLQSGFKTNFPTNNFSEFNKTVWGMTYGGGVEYRIKSIGILLEMAGYPDFTTIQKAEPSATSTGLKITGQSYTLFTGIKYYLSKD